MVTRSRPLTPTRERGAIAAIPADQHEWRPMVIERSHRVPEIVNPVVEPLWSGDRVIVHFMELERPREWGDITVLDEFGDDALDLAPVALDFLRRSIHATDAVIDGIMTTQATGGGEGTATVLQAHARPMKSMFVGGLGPDVTVEPVKGGRQAGDPAFVALDLLSIDGQTLFDVPLLERKRLLESAIEESELVRVSPVVRPPLRRWFATWRSAGLKGLMLKASNSRYQPGGETSEWATVERMPRA